MLAVVKEELLLGEPIESIFKEFDPVPLGSASIAQARTAQPEAEAEAEAYPYLYL